ncbi:hypothetical protein BRARA_A03438 [Brassica rapa]|uniref:E3 ubiquitin-protein ligase RNF123/RKP TPR repeat domain-containing protein n=1 Tax=Brassica campestris TaxID=3711 RepID=A0A398AT77_BRACM|nr:uncharacterized protein LOC103860773 [Brassica rapa]RID80802.1 hypothetical protein BRARA_A03438 [Brassica rapa]
MQEKYQVMEFQQRKCCVILELSSNLPRVLEVCTSAIPQAFLDGTDTNPSRLAEEGTNVPEVALPEVVVPGRDDKDGLMLPVPDVLQRPNTKEQLAIALLSFPFSFKSIFFLFQKLMLLLLFQLLTMAQTALFL